MAPINRKNGRGPLVPTYLCAVAVTLLARTFHLLPMEEPPEELGELLNPDRLMAETAQEAAPQTPKLPQKPDVPQGRTGREARQETGTKASSRRYILRSGRMFGILSSFPLNGIKEKANSKGFAMGTAGLPMRTVLVQARDGWGQEQ